VCNYGLVLAGVDCDGDMLISAAAVAPDEKGHSLGDVVSVVSTGTAQGSFCYDNYLGPPPVLFDVDVRATYQLTFDGSGRVCTIHLDRSQFRFCSRTGDLGARDAGAGGLGGWIPRQAQVQRHT
jgi:hypothetical protein